MQLERALKKSPEERTEGDADVIYQVLCEQRVLKAKSEYIKREMCRMVGYEVFAPGSPIIKEGETGDKFYMILSGIVDIYVSAAGRDPVTHMSPGQDFGEQALQQKDARRNATCTARTRCELITLNRENYTSILMLGDTHKKTFDRVGYPNLDTEYIFTTVALQGAHLETDGGVAIAEALKTNPRVHTVDLTGNLIGPSAGGVMGAALAVNECVTSLNLAGNEIGDVGATALGEGLLDNDILVRLNLRNNSIGDLGVHALAEALRTNTTLTTLDLSLNKITDEGARYLAEALKGNKALVSLRLERNAFTDSGNALLTRLMRANTGLYIDGTRPKINYGFAPTF